MLVQKFLYIIPSMSYQRISELVLIFLYQLQFEKLKSSFTEILIYFNIIDGGVILLVISLSEVEVGNRA